MISIDDQAMAIQDAGSYVVLMEVMDEEGLTGQSSHALMVNENITGRWIGTIQYGNNDTLQLIGPMDFSQENENISATHTTRVLEEKNLVSQGTINGNVIHLEGGWWTIGFGFDMSDFFGIDEGEIIDVTVSPDKELITGTYRHILLKRYSLTNKLVTLEDRTGTIRLGRATE
jgi:hypothetical protein